MNILRSTQGLAIVALVVGESVQLPSEAVAAEQPISFGQEIGLFFSAAALNAINRAARGTKSAGWICVPTKA